MGSVTPTAPKASGLDKEGEEGRERWTWIIEAFGELYYGPAGGWGGYVPESDNAGPIAIVQVCFKWSLSMHIAPHHMSGDGNIG